ncbi:DUF192 domain-containing protein [Puniceibacterium sediminis]|uniref:DUF192 domain-containing protein n=1 Tax=Puniceibacterium sediminis TaxID=1608407 RepID=A0A238XHI2_9RHOB|nr:DUF192 domain-containing protein [Puniceibacterium sediminis]SNR58048.1 hypothetical protein SAMN06265370_11166 [Puniceibacterium sediminis]
MGSRIKRSAISAIGAIFLWTGAAHAESNCREDALWLRGDWGSARFGVKVADDDKERSRGLMFVEKMAMGTGMLFVYPRPQDTNFWMKNTLIPLDIIFADHRGVVQTVHPDAVPGDLTPIPGGQGIQYVLEINGGLAKSMGIVPGSVFQHPAIAQDSAAWACPAQ